MKLYQIISVIAIFLTQLSCETRKNDIMIKANNLHLEALATQNKLEEKIEKMKNDAVRQNDSVSLLKIDSLSNLIHLWEDGVIEVPGFSHDHRGHEGEAHEHKPAPQMTDESMLEYQQNAKAAIDELDIEISKIVIGL